MRALFHILSQDEQIRAKYFKFERDRKRFIVGRGLLRVILSRYLDMSPEQLLFCYGNHGKPRLADIYDRDVPLFNLSHSHGYAIYAITYGRELGVDLEYIRFIPDADQVAKMFFSPLENFIYSSLPPNKRIEAFFNCWTRKEAYIKARGDGFSHFLDQFDVSLTPGEPAQLLNANDDPEKVLKWSLRELIPVEGYKAAIAIEGPVWRLFCWRWSENWKTISFCQVNFDKFC